MSSENKYPPRGHIPQAQLKWFEDGASIYAKPLEYEPFNTVEYLSLTEHTDLIAKAKADLFDEWIDYLKLAITTERSMPLSQRGEGAQDCRIDFISMLKREKTRILGPILPKHNTKAALPTGEKEV